MNAYALKAPAQNWKLPAWATMHNLVVAVIVAAVLVVVIGLVVTNGRLAKLARAAAAAAAAPAPKKSGGGGGKLLLAAGAVVGGLLAWGHYKPAASGAKAAPAPSPSPVPHPVPTVTRTVAPPAGGHSGSPNVLAQLTAWMNHLTGTDWVLIVLIGAVATFVIVRPLLKRGD